MLKIPTDAGPNLVTKLPGPKAAAWIARDEAVISPSYTRDYPLVAARGEGCLLDDFDGNRFLDFMTIGCISVDLDVPIVADR